MSDIRRILELKIAPERGIVLVLDDLEHRDYIEDVLVEHFDIEYEYFVKDEKSGINTLYFADTTDIIALEKTISEINKHHSSSSELYKTI
ncbi:hypothetical protein [Rheinheimera oceanensis]|uniref:hypothetical protein n=1 Tax=Rheinheimera oceanensis TaxID=2817449 RepID=UPI001BFE6BCC|nr:hypothetical protein [Rheinheimera oceanensis]